MLCHQETADTQVPSVKLVLSGGRSMLEGTMLVSPSPGGDREDVGPQCGRGMGRTRALHQAPVPEGPGQLLHCKGEQIHT